MFLTCCAQSLCVEEVLETSYSNLLFYLWLLHWWSSYHANACRSPLKNNVLVTPRDSLVFQVKDIFIAYTGFFIFFVKKYYPGYHQEIWKFDSSLNIFYWFIHIFLDLFINLFYLIIEHFARILSTVIIQYSCVLFLNFYSCHFLLWDFFNVLIFLRS